MSVIYNNAHHINAGLYDNDWVKKCMKYEVEGSRPRGRPTKTWREIVEKDCRHVN